MKSELSIRDLYNDTTIGSSLVDKAYLTPIQLVDGSVRENEEGRAKLRYAQANRMEVVNLGFPNAICQLRLIPKGRRTWRSEASY